MVYIRLISVQSMRIPGFLLLLLLSSQLVYASASKEYLSTADLQRQFPDSELLQLSANDNDFLLLQHETLTSYTKGTAILVPDSNEHASSPKHLGFLRSQLAELGWNTLAIMPPDRESENTEHRQHLQSRIEAVLRHAREQPGTLIIIAQGDNAAELTAMFANGNLSEEPAALILLGAYQTNEENNQQLAKAIATQKIPTLDISHSMDSRFVIQQLKLRRQLAEKHMKAVYRQRYITGSGYDAEIQHWVLKEIYGWLDSVGL